ncbi:microfibril-associated glycoprotein 4-like [Watersipora subatra]|uniref:microfibril-associated glycoprotein 4-like n=1 Tax=Watersipora subatra TaxID=2589382 RepID=UPI00355BD3B1
MMIALSNAFLLLFLVSVSSQHLAEPASHGRDLVLYRKNIYAVRRILQNECPDLIQQKHGVYDDSELPFHLKYARFVYTDMLEILTECLTNQTNFGPVTEPIPLVATQSLARDQAITESLTTDGDVNTRPITTQPVSSDLPVPQDCQELYNRGVRCQGVYLIKPLHAGDEPFSVWCDFIDDHGWTVIQKRVNGLVNFNKNWTDYQAGFGDIEGEYWLGLDKIHALTRLNNQLHIFLKAANGTSKFGIWSSFYVNDIADGYRLMISNAGYEGSLDSSSLSYNNGMKFSTPDRDNDGHSSYNCAAGYTGAWWFKNCLQSQLNGVYGATGWGGIVWKTTANHFTESVMRVTRS